MEIKPKEPENNPQASEYTPFKTEDKPEVKPLHSSSFVSTFRPAETKPPDEIKPLLTRSKDKSSVIKSGIYSCKNCLKAFDSGKENYYFNLVIILHVYMNYIEMLCCVVDIGIELML